MKTNHARNAAKELYPNGVGNYCYPTHEQNMNAMERDWDKVASVIQTHAINPAVDEATRELREQIEKERCTTSFVCGAHIGSLKTVVTDRFMAGCPACERDLLKQKLRDSESHRARAVEALKVIAASDEQSIWDDDRDDAANAMLYVAREALERMK